MHAGENMFLRDFARLGSWSERFELQVWRFGNIFISQLVNPYNTYQTESTSSCTQQNHTNAACWETCLSANPYHGARLNACCGFSGVHGRRVVKKPDSPKSHIFLKQSLGFRLKAKKCLDLKQLKTQIFANFWQSWYRLIQKQQSLFKGTTTDTIYARKRKKENC